MKDASGKKTYTYLRTETGAFDIPAAEKPIVEPSNLELRPEFYRQEVMRMKMEPFKIKTPRGTFNIHTVFANEEEAEKEGWGVWFQHEDYLILGKDNCVGAVIKVGSE